MNPAEPGFGLSRDRITALTLAASQAIIGSVGSISISTGGLTGYMLLGADKSLATAPVTGFNLGVALGALPAAWLIARLGRRNGFMSGAGITAVGGALAASAIVFSNFWLFAAALVLLGSGNAFVQQYRFAAADSAPPAFKAKAISWVLAGGVFAAVIGPQTAIHGRDLLAPYTFAGGFLGIVMLALIGALILSTLRIGAESQKSHSADHAPARPLSAILLQPRFIVAMLCGIGSYALMSFIMTGAPLAMVGAGCSESDALLGISWHVMAMFAPSFFTGNLIARFGKVRVITTGLVLLTGAALTGLAGDTVLFFWTSLILLGLGWNFGFIGSTALIAETYHPSEKGKVQGFHDFVLFSLVAFASLMAGLIYTRFGWQTLNHIAFPIIGVCLAALVVLKWLELRQKRA